MNKKLIKSLELSGRLPVEQTKLIAAETDLETIMHYAKEMTESFHGDLLSYSKKIFIPLTMLCRDVCHYCTFAKPPIKGQKVYLTADEVLELARAGEKAGCKEALFTLGDKPELRYKAAREELDKLGFSSTIDYLHAMAKLVLDNTTLIPHLNPGVMEYEQIIKLKEVSASQGIMLESI